MTGHGAKFGRQKEQAILALLSERNIEGAARATGIGTTTLKRWMQNPEFQAAYLKARQDAYGQGIARLQQNSSAAAATLLKIMIDENAPAASRVRAADRVLEHGASALQVEELQQRVQRLEQRDQKHEQEDQDDLLKAA